MARDPFRQRLGAEESASAAPVARSIHADAWILARARFLQLRNVIDQQLREAPLRTLAAIVVLVILWRALYLLLDLIFQQVRGWDLIGVVADQHLFVHFFLVLAVMLAFSNAILSFGALFGRDEATYLLALPVRARGVVWVKWVEGMTLSSWSFLLLGLPLMMAVAANSEVSWYYYPLFLAHFCGFVAIPASLGLLAAWAVAMWSPRRPMMVAVGIGFVLLLIAIYWLSAISQQAMQSEQWLRIIFRQVGVAKQWWIPSTWTAKGIVAAMRQDVRESVFYLLVVAANAVFLTWATVNVLGVTWAEAYSRAQHGRAHPTIRWGWVTGLVTNLLFFYLPPRLRWVMLKDLRAFARDPKQWSQMLIMLGLLVLYVLNLRRLPMDFDSPYVSAVIAFLNLTTVSLILATFTSRFVYPLLSLESQQLWLIEMLPVRRRTLLLVKFYFALTVTALSGLAVMSLAVNVLNLPTPWGRMHLATCMGICVGLSGLSIGLGARFPELRHRNPARIAAGFGGALNLVASMVFVCVEMAGVAWLCVTELRGSTELPEGLSPFGLQVLGGLLVFSLLVALGSLWIGARHFERLET